MLYFKDTATPSGVQAGFVEHEEMEISDDELARLKGRARKAVTMDSAPKERAMPSEYTQGFLRQGGTSYEDFLSGKG